MQLKKAKLALAASAIAIGATSTAYAASETFNITATTVPDVTITELQALDFGSNMYVTAGGTCLMNATTPGDAATALMQYDGATDAAANYGDLTGGGCVNGAAAGTPGVYRIAGLPATAVNITITGVVGADFNFAPNSGCIVLYANNATADDCTAFIPGTTTARQLAAATEDAGTGGGVGTSTAGQLVFTVGGTVTVGGTDLTANTAYTENFTVDVIY